MQHEKPQEVFAVNDVVRFNRQDLSHNQVDGLIRMITSHGLTEPLVVKEVKTFDNPCCRGHKQQITVETIGDNKKTITITGFWFSKADYNWIKERHGQG